MATDTKTRADEQKAQDAKEVRDPNGVLTTVGATKGDPVGPSGTPRDPQPLQGETGSAYTQRMRAISQGDDPGKDAVRSSPTDPTPLSGVNPEEDPLGISTGRVAQTQIEQDSKVKATVPGAARGDEADAEADADRPKRGKLPEDFPGRAALEANDITTYSQVRRAIERDQLTELNGIGEATAEKIKAEAE